MRSRYGQSGRLPPQEWAFVRFDVDTGKKTKKDGPRSHLTLPTHRLTRI